MALPDEIRDYLAGVDAEELLERLRELRPDVFPPVPEDGQGTIDMFIAELRDMLEIIELREPRWDAIGRLAVLFGAAVQASDLSLEDARRAFARFEGATEWQGADKPLPGERVQ